MVVLYVCMLNGLLGSGYYGSFWNMRVEDNYIIDECCVGCGYNNATFCRMVMVGYFIFSK